MMLSALFFFYRLSHFFSPSFFQGYKVGSPKTTPGALLQARPSLLHPAGAAMRSDVPHIDNVRLANPSLSLSLSLSFLCLRRVTGFPPSAYGLP